MKPLCNLIAVLFLSVAAFCQVAPAPNVHAEVHINDPAVQKPVNVHIMARHAEGVNGCHAEQCVFFDNWQHNLRTTGGADWQANAMGATSGQPATATYIALTNDSGTAAAGDCAAGSTTCTLTSEITTLGLARHVATYSHSNGTNTWSLNYTWTATGTQSVQKAGMFNATSSGTMVFEANFTQVNLVSTDTFTATWTVTY